MKIPFSIKYRPQIESGEYKVETRDGRKARIVHWDLNCTSPIVAVMDAHIDLPGEIVDVFSVSGRAFDDLESPSDLFIVTPGPTDMSEFGMKVSEFAEAYELAATDCESEEYKTCNGNLQLIIDKYAAEILALARKELENEAPSIIHVQSFNAGLKHGKAEALKDLPRWEKDKSFETEGTFMGIKGREYFVVKDGYSISVAELIERLPGFKEGEK